MNKKGFTLVELLSVIAILSILIIISIPSIMDLYNEAKERSFITEVKRIYSVAKQKWMNDSIEQTNSKIYARSENGNCSNYLSLSGRKEIHYHVKIDKNGNVVELYAEDGTYQYIYHGDNLKIENIEYVSKIVDINESDRLVITCDGVSIVEGLTPSIASFVNRQVDGQITKGDEVVIADENFYVVSSNSDETVLLTKYDINTKSNSQVTSGQTNSKFANKGYWDYEQCVNNGGWVCNQDNSGLMSPYSDNGAYCESINGNNCAYVYDENSLIYSKVNLYVNKIAEITGANITGRLMTKDEAKELKSANTAGSKAVKDKNGKTYWLGTAYGRRFIWNVDSSGVISGNFYSNSYAIRPVIIVSTSLISGGENLNNNGNTGNLTGTNIAQFVYRQTNSLISSADELKIADENFYVVSSNQYETVLLAKYDLNASSNAQISSGQTQIQFATEGYWDGLQCVYKDGTWKCLGTEEGLLSPYNNDGKVYCEKAYLDNCAYVYDSNSNLNTIVNEYAYKIESLTGARVTGRLLTLEEAYRLANENNSTLDMLKDKTGGKYWLGTAYGKRFIWNVDSSGSITGTYFTNKFGVRPVIVVSTSAL